MRDAQIEILKNRIDVFEKELKNRDEKIEELENISSE